jgi:hypothetical protein
MSPIQPYFASLLAFGQNKATSAPTVRTMAATPVVPPAFLEAIAVNHRENVSKIVLKPTITAKYTEESFLAHENVYKWLLEHPDRVSLAWQRMKVECVEITDAGNGNFTWSDPDGSQLTWQSVAKLPDGLVWYATGKVKAAALLPMISVKAVAYVKYPSKPTETKGIVSFTPETVVYLQTDSRAANMVMRLAGPAAPKMAEDGAERRQLPPQEPRATRKTVGREEEVERSFPMSSVVPRSSVPLNSGSSWQKLSCAIQDRW